MLSLEFLNLRGGSQYERIALKSSREAKTECRLAREASLYGSDVMQLVR
jgi:hypothetical protein